MKSVGIKLTTEKAKVIFHGQRFTLMVNVFGRGRPMATSNNAQSVVLDRLERFDRGVAQKRKTTGAA